MFTCPFCKGTHYTFITTCPATKEIIPAVYRFKGRVLEGKYEVLDPIGEGGMGVVYEGRHRQIGRKVAIKFLQLTSHASEEMIARFRNEARIAASIAHKNIVEILDMGTSEEGVHYTVMAYLEGSPLTEMLTHAPLSEGTAMKIAIEILSGLNAVHSKVITHRDIKPDNIFIVEQAGGEQLVKILDFGISHLAKLPGGESLLKTKTGMVFGTPKYMSPEQARGSKTIDARSDLYSVGVILYEMLTGRLPFDADNYNELIIAITTKDPIPPGVFNPGLSPDLERIVLKSLRKDPGTRYQTAAEFAAYLSMFRPHEDEEEMPSVVTHLPPELLERIRLGGAPTPSKPIIRTRLTTPRSGGDIATDMTLPGVATPLPGVSTSLTPQEYTRTTLRKKGSKRAVLAVVVSLSLLIPAALAAAYVLVKNGRDSGGKAEVLSRPAAGTASQKQEKTSVERWKVTLEGLPQGAAVHVDGVLHPETPLIIEKSASSRKIRIEAGGYETWEKSVAVQSDVTFSIQMNPLSSAAGVSPGSGAPGSEKKLKIKKSKPQSEVDDAETKAKPKAKIDVVFPGLPQH